MRAHSRFPYGPSLRLAGWALVTAAVGGMLGCGGGGGGGPVAPPPPPTSDALVFSRNRDPQTGFITPVLGESGAGFDALEVDSPAIAVDSARVLNDYYLMYYEANSTAGVSTIGVVSSSDADLAPIVATRRQAVGLGAGGSGFEAGATDPTVVVDTRPVANPPLGTQRYKMWFEGRGGAGGAVSSILFAASADGLTWGSFAVCTGLEAASFAGVRVADPTVVLDGGTYRMWFEAIATVTATGDGPGSVGYAESADGIHWTVVDAAGNSGAAAGPVLGPGAAGGFDAYGVGSPSVVIDPTVTPGADGRFLMWYEAADVAGTTESSIGYASSPDGRSWTRLELAVLAPSSDALVPLPFDSGDLEHPAAALDVSLPKDADGHFLLWYTGDAEASSTVNRIGFATGRLGAASAP